jgi:hypothetical protein
MNLDHGLFPVVFTQVTAGGLSDGVLHGGIVKARGFGHVRHGVERFGDKGIA